VNELYIPSDGSLSATLVPTCRYRVSRGQCDGSVRPYSWISNLEPLLPLLFQVAPQLYSRGWLYPVPDPLLRKYGSARNWCRKLWICSQELWPLDHRGGQFTMSVLRIYLSLFVAILCYKKQTFREWMTPNTTFRKLDLFLRLQAREGRNPLCLVL
jgi:hypothetical protein